MSTTITGSYALQSVSIVSPPPTADWKLRGLYEALCRGENAVLSVLQGKPTDSGKYVLLGTLKTGTTKFALSGISNRTATGGDLVDSSDAYNMLGASCLEVNREGATLDAKVYYGDRCRMIEVMSCKFADRSRPEGCEGGRVTRGDSRLIGRWQWSEFSNPGGFSGGFSASYNRFRDYSADGRVVESTSSFASLQMRHSTGSWAGSTNAARTVSQGSRGAWQADGRNLEIAWDDGRTSRLEYHVERVGMLLRDRFGQKYWQRL